MPVTAETLAAKKAAKAAYDREYRAKNAERLKARHKAYGTSAVKKAADARYREAHAEELAAYKRVWRAENKDRIAAARKAKHAENLEIRKAESRRDYLKRSEEIKATVRKWREENPERHSAAQREYYALNAERVKQRSRTWRIDNPERKAANDKAWAQANPLKVKLNKALRRARVRQATPCWADRTELDDVYLEALHMQMHVDHIIPLKHRLVCGLHVPENLQLLTASENARKSNKFNPETFDARQ